MRCDCCDRALSDMESTAKFADGRYVNMCKKCQGFLPPETKVIQRYDLEKTLQDDEEYVDEFNFGEEDGDE